jgi:hypothetical protein
MGKERKVCKVLVGKPKGKRLSEDQGIDERMGSEWILGNWLGGGDVDSIRLAQGRDWWQAVVNAVMSFRVLVPQS